MAGIYVHIPFCHSKCSYCDFYSMSNRSKQQALVNALSTEYNARKDEISNIIKTIYFGGGTPSILDSHQLESIFGCIRPAHNLDECTIECNPEDVTISNAKAWRDIGFNRVSMGIQSFDDNQLSLIGRRHTAAQAIEAVETLTKAGFDNYSLDLIYGLPGQSIESWTESLEKLLSFKPKHFSAYMLSYEPRTRLTAMLKRGEVFETDEETLAKMYEALCQNAHSQGYNHYEISNFALPGYEAKHNSSYWDGTPYLGLGPSAHSFDGNKRRINPANLTHYLQGVQERGTAYEYDEEDDDNRFNDLLITSLRTAKGLDLRKVPDKRLHQLLQDAMPYMSTGSLREEAGRIFIPEPYWLISDAIISDLIQV